MLYALRFVERGPDAGTPVPAAAEFKGELTLGFDLAGIVNKRFRKVDIGFTDARRH